MPIPVPVAGDDSTGGLPTRLLQPLIGQLRRETFDPTDGSETTVWEQVEFLGRVARGASSEVDDMGRQASVTRYKLLTNFDGLHTEDRVVDPEGDDTAPWQLDGDPWPVYGGTGVHHYEANLRRVDG